MSNILYRGFSTVGRTKKFRAVDFDLIKQDLINHFNIRKGEKLMNPDFGTIIWSLLFEPMTGTVRDQIISDVKTIVNYDPRIGVQTIDIAELDHGIQISIGLIYLQTNETSALAVKFDQNSKTVAFA
jgi:phage baseplate assembly protein W